MAKSIYRVNDRVRAAGLVSGAAYSGMEVA